LTFHDDFFRLSLIKRTTFQKQASMTPKIPVFSFDLHEVDDLILKILSRNHFGLSANKIRNDLPASHRIPSKKLAERLDGLLAKGRLHAWQPPKGRAQKPPLPIYSLDPLEPLIATETLQLLKNESLTPSEIKKSFPPHVNKYLLNLLDPLIKNGTVKWYPPLKGKRVGLQEPNPGDFLSAEIKRLFEKGEKLGFQVEAILQGVQAYAKPSTFKKPPTLTAEETERIILKAMSTLKPAAAQGALVYIPDLREALRSTFPDKESFDRAILHLARLEKVQLQSYSLPAELTEEQRQAMIDNQRGSYFMAVGVRME
jgi:hypothetical protein